MSGGVVDLANAGFVEHWEGEEPAPSFTWEERYPTERAPDPDIDGESFHDFRDQGDPIEKREPGTWRDWERDQQRKRTPGMGRR